ncbi:unnamed protein product [Trichogramma brassicae]|uniref:Uncharacterized protein n=1 Tax=Trichogramma brassicae TaxID=86971 RepID=A0A6H5IVW7_9HYME|nr:unnamed protein product [Trichogramma brassicae]
MNANFDKLLARLAVINERLDKVAQTQLKQGAAILQNSRTIAQLDERLSGELNELRRRQNESSEMLSKLQKRLTVFASTARDADVPPTSSTPTVDSCKVRVTGIPTSLSDSDITTTERILKALQLDRLTPHVISVRPWTAGRADTLNTPSASTTAGVRPDARRERAIVVRLASAIACETFLAAAPSLRSMKASSIFALHEDTTSQLNLSPLLPPAQYRLLQKYAASTTRLNCVIRFHKMKGVFEVGFVKTRYCMDSAVTRMEGVARSVVKLDERLTEQENALKVNAESISAIRQELLHVTKTVQNIQMADCSPAPQHTQHLTDDCEVLLSGLPLESTLTDTPCWIKPSRI